MNERKMSKTRRILEGKNGRRKKEKKGWEKEQEKE